MSLKNQVRESCLFKQLLHAMERKRDKAKARLSQALFCGLAWSEDEMPEIPSQNPLIRGSE